MASRIAKTPPPLDILLVTLPGFPSLSNPNFEIIEITSSLVNTGEITRFKLLHVILSRTILIAINITIGETGAKWNNFFCLPSLL
jgi:hypothetical protein